MSPVRLFVEALGQVYCGDQAIKVPVVDEAGTLGGIYSSTRRSNTKAKRATR